MKKRARPKFRGFPEPKVNFTGLPNIFFDEVMPCLKEAELKVMLYIFRKTYGWHKEVDCISVSQFMDGIVTKRGKRLDYGTGLSKSAIIESLQSVVEAEYILRFIPGSGGGRRSYFFLNTEKNRRTLRALKAETVKIEQVVGSKFRPSVGPKFRPSSPDVLGSDFGHTKQRGVQKTKYQHKESTPQDDPRLEVRDEGLCRMMINKKRHKEGYTREPRPLGFAIREIDGKLQSLRQTAHETSDPDRPADESAAPQTEPGPEPAAPAGGPDAL